MGRQRADPDAGIADLDSAEIDDAADINQQGRRGQP